MPSTLTLLGTTQLPMLVAMLLEKGLLRWVARSARGPLPVA